MKGTQWGILFFVTGALLFFTFDVYGHPPCESEQQAVDDAEEADTRANAEVQALWGQIRAQQLHMGLSSTDTADSKKDEDRLEELMDKYEAAVKKRDGTGQDLDDAREALDNCTENDPRDCPGKCSKLHTQNVTSCECNCEYSISQGCECGPCSAYSGG